MSLPRISPAPPANASPEDLAWWYLSWVFYYRALCDQLREERDAARREVCRLRLAQASALATGYQNEVGHEMVTH